MYDVKIKNVLKNAITKKFNDVKDKYEGLLDMSFVDDICKEFGLSKCDYLSAIK